MIMVLITYVKPNVCGTRYRAAGPCSHQPNAGNRHASITALHCSKAMPAETFDLLRLLSDASFHSGAALARELDASPAAVRLALRELEDLGLKLVRARGRGYPG